MQKQAAETEAKPAVEQPPTADQTVSDSAHAAPESQPAPSKGISSAFRQERSAEADREPVEQTPIAGHSIDDSIHAASGSLPVPSKGIRPSSRQGQAPEIHTAPLEQPPVADSSIEDSMDAASGSQRAASKGMGSASRQEQSAETDTEPVQQPLGAVHGIGASVYAAPESQPRPGASAQASQTTANKRSPTRPQPSQKQPNGVAHPEPQQFELPWLPAQAAQAAAPAAQEEEPWQEVRKPRRKPSSQQAVSPSKSNSRKAAKEGRGAPVQDTPALSPPRPREAQTASQLPGQPLRHSLQAIAPPRAQPVHAAAEQLPGWLTALSLSEPQQPLQHAALDPLQFPASMQHEALQASANGTSQHKAYMPFQKIPHTELQPRSSPHEQV